MSRRKTDDTEVAIMPSKAVKFDGNKRCNNVITVKVVIP